MRTSLYTDLALDMSQRRRGQGSRASQGHLDDNSAALDHSAMSRTLNGTMTLNRTMTNML